MTTILMPDDKDLNATDAGADSQGSTIKKIKFEEAAEIISELTNSKEGRWRYTCTIIDDPYKPSKPKESRIRAWLRKRKEQKKGRMEI